MNIPLRQLYSKLPVTPLTNIHQGNTKTIHIRSHMISDIITESSSISLNIQPSATGINLHSQISHP